MFNIRNEVDRERKAREESHLMRGEMTVEALRELNDAEEGSDLIEVRGNHKRGGGGGVTRKSIQELERGNIVENGQVDPEER